MNCPDFEMIVDDLARGRMMEATQRASGLAHADACAHCASRLADERWLTRGLRSVATDTENNEAPARVEAALLAAFRERDGRAALLNPAARPATPAGRQSFWRVAGGAAAAAAAALAALVFVAFVASRTRPEQPAAQAVAERGSQALKLSAWPSVREEGRAIEPEPGVGLRSGRGLTPQPVAFERTPRGIRRGAMGGSNAAGNAIGGAQPLDAATNSTASDISTDFIPLTYGGGLDGLDSGRVVRVELPRSALVRFGLPVNAERAGEPVKADVLLGEDGLAQAIRFVR
ncbi:MAG TPA: hypothetical protein VGX92_15710 [Pyrinomonadaceae bacterium]|jgi:hypothetical protein|nr:hypothetical protein [Pyrinomonadaceae bacterium]